MNRFSTALESTEIYAGTAAVVLVAVIGAAITGALASISPLAGIGIGAIVVVSSLASLGRRLTGVFLGGLGITLVGYAFFGRSFAYLGVPPLFISELMIALGVFAFVLNPRLPRLRLIHGLIFLFMAWGAIHTLPYVGTYGIDALRDAVIWGYAVIALIVSFMLKRRHMEHIVSWYGRLIPFFVLWAPLSLIIPMVVDGLPTMPMSSVPVVVPKAGDIAVHLSGVGAFIIAGLYARNSELRPARDLVLWAAWLGAAGIAAVMNRGGLVALSISMAAAMLLRPSRHVATAVIAGSLLITTLIAVDPVADLKYHREISIDQLMENTVSIFGTSQRSGTVVLEGTREWRLQWWSDIFDYTFNGPYRWTGKGFGINLANSDGFQTIAPAADAAPVRSPHNGHLTVLARSGVPGFVFWILLQATFGLSMFRGFLNAYRTRQLFWMQVDFWILIYWMAIMINSSFDVYLEGPQGGIWFWTLIGVGIAALRFQYGDENSDDERDTSRDGEVVQAAREERAARVGVR